MSNTTPKFSLMWTPKGVLQVVQEDSDMVGDRKAYDPTVFPGILIEACRVEQEKILLDLEASLRKRREARIREILVQAWFLLE